MHNTCIWFICNHIIFFFLSISLVVSYKYCYLGIESNKNVWFCKLKCHLKKNHDYFLSCIRWPITCWTLIVSLTTTKHTGLPWRSNPSSLVCPTSQSIRPDGKVSLGLPLEKSQSAKGFYWGSGFPFNDPFQTLSSVVVKAFHA